MVGEVGVIKREIVYSGDILNTTARMMEQCNLHHQKLIISDKVADLIPEEKRKDYECTSLGDFPLRGKTMMICLYGVKKQEYQRSADPIFDKDSSGLLSSGGETVF